MQLPHSKNQTKRQQHALLSLALLLNPLDLQSQKVTMLNLRVSLLTCRPVCGNLMQSAYPLLDKIPYQASTTFLSCTIVVIGLTTLDCEQHLCVQHWKS